jgi:hypothetical protein
MPFYIVGGNASDPSNPSGSPVPRHSGWETPAGVQGSHSVFQVSRGAYLPGTLDVAISAEPDGEIGYSTQYPPAYEETDPANGIITLSQDLPADWLFIVRYIF